MRGCDEYYLTLLFLNTIIILLRDSLEFLTEGTIKHDRKVRWTFVGENSYSFIGSVSMDNNPYFYFLTHRNCDNVRICN